MRRRRRSRPARPQRRHGRAAGSSPGQQEAVAPGQPPSRPATTVQQDIRLAKISGGMTLTISLVADGLVVQSADHRLVELPSRRIVDDAERKQLVVQLGMGTAVISFAGIGGVRGRRSASQLLYDTAVKAGEPFQISLDELVDELRRTSTEWLHAVRGDRRHSFVVAAMEDVGDQIVTRLLLVSNYQTITGQRSSTLQVEDEPRALDNFSVSSEVVGEPTVLVAGMHPAVRDEDRIALTRMVRDRRKSIQLARRMAYVNRNSASRSQAEGMVSPHCTTAALLLSRTQINGMTLAHTDQEREIPIEIVQVGTDQRRMMQEALKKVWREQGYVGTPVLRGSSTTGKTLKGTTAGSPYADSGDSLFV